jgi:hypothetical protein
MLIKNGKSLSRLSTVTLRKSFEYELFLNQFLMRIRMKEVTDY